MPAPRSSVTSVPSAFLSYAREDGEVVREFAVALESEGVNALFDVDFLQPGQRWQETIVDRLKSADALVFFVSAASLRSSWVEAELVAFADASERPIVPVLLPGIDFDQLPAHLAKYQGVRLSNELDLVAAASTIAEIVRATSPCEASDSVQANFHAAKLADDLASDLRGGPIQDTDLIDDAVFLVHGHDHVFRTEVEELLDSLGIRPVVLSKVGAPSRSLFQKFESLARRAQFAVVLLSADDFGASRVQYEHEKLGGPQTLKYRARENVVLELGFFYGRLGWDRVFVVQKPPPEVWPDFERPSDLDGIVNVEISKEYDWRDELRASLVEAGLATAGVPPGESGTAR